MASEIWGSKKESYEGIRDCEEGLYQKTNNTSDLRRTMEYMNISQRIISCIRLFYDLLCTSDEFDLELYKPYIEYVNQDVLVRIREAKPITDTMLKVGNLQLEQLQKLIQKLRTTNSQSLAETVDNGSKKI